MGQATPLIRNPRDARQAVRFAGGTGLVLAAYNLLAVALGAGFSALDGEAAYDPARLVGTVLLGVAAALTFRGSRVGALGLLGLHLYSVLLRVPGLSLFGSLVVGGLALLYVMGVRGAFYLHRRRPDDEVEAGLARLEEAPPAPLT